MIKRSLVIALSFLAVSACKTASKDSGTDLAAARVARGSSQIIGYDFTGLKAMNPAKRDMICTQEVKAEDEACREAGGKSIWAENCKVMCSIPIAPKGKVAGFNFDKLVITDELPGDMFCPQVVTAEQEACGNVGGKAVYANQCKVLCSKPLAKKGKVSGYDFDGYQLNVSPMPKDMVCTAVLRPEDEACEKAGGTAIWANNCKVLCSDLINR